IDLGSDVRAEERFVRRYSFRRMRLRCSQKCSSCVLNVMDAIAFTVCAPVRAAPFDTRIQCRCASLIRSSLCGIRSLVRLKDLDLAPLIEEGRPEAMWRPVRLGWR